MSSGRRSPDKDDGKGRDLAPHTDTRASSKPGTTSPSPSRPQWSTKRSTPLRGATGEPEGSRSPAADELTDESSDDSEDDSDELEDESMGRREMSSSVMREQVDVSGKEFQYVLEVIQQPQRARACGFGDKDRRPLSPPPIIQLRIYDQQGNLVSPLAVDFHRFIIMVDLWNGDCSQQRSIVMHPGARQDQYALFTHAARASSSSHPYEQPQPTFSRAPLRSVPSAGYQGGDWQMYGGYPSHSQGSSSSHPYGHPSSQYPPSASTTSGAHFPSWSPPPHRHELVPRGHPGASPARAAYGLPPHGGWHEHGSSRHALLSPGDAYPPHHGARVPPSTRDSRGWTSDYMGGEYVPEHGSYPSSSSFRPSTTSGVEGGWREPPPFAGSSRDRPHSSGHDDRDYHRYWSSSSESQRPRSSHGPLFTHVPAISPISSHGSLPPVGGSPSMGGTVPLYPESYGERMSSTSYYSRVLVGSMGAVCQRLKGLDGQPGLFFFAHDLGIRTEGTFSLRFTLVDISSLSVPGVVQDQSTHMLARLFSQPFTVYSAKRFPGVLPTTDLTQCFADQSVRLPTRQKRAHNHGSSGPRRKK